LGLNLLKLFFDETVNSSGYLAQVPELPESGHPRLFRCLGVGDQFPSPLPGRIREKGFRVRRPRIWHGERCFAYGLETQAFPSFQLSFGLQPIFQVMALDGATFQEEFMRANGNLLLTRRAIAGCVQLNFGKIDWISRHGASSTEEKRGYQPLPF
jgi:hypothetical protein